MSSSPNRFYSVFTTYQTLPESDYQLRQLPDEIVRGHSIMISDGRGRTRGGEASYSPTTQKDYDEEFVSKILKLDPPYLLEEFLDFHYEYYTDTPDNNPDIFIKHIKYVILPTIKRGKREEFIELISEWLAKKTQKTGKTDFERISNTLRFNDVEIKSMNSKLDVMLDRFAKMEKGQEIIYDDLHQEFEELREMLEILNKKNWKELFQGKMISLGLAKLSDKAMDLIKDSNLLNS